MKDKLIEGYLKDFVDAHEFTDLSQSQAFEQFVNYCIASREHRACVIRRCESEDFKGNKGAVGKIPSREEQEGVREFDNPRSRSGQEARFVSGGKDEDFKGSKGAVGKV